MKKSRPHSRSLAGAQGVAEQRLHHVDRSPAYALERAQFAFAALKRAASSCAAGRVSSPAQYLHRAARGSQRNIDAAAPCIVGRRGGSAWMQPLWMHHYADTHPRRALIAVGGAARHPCAARARYAQPRACGASQTLQCTRYAVFRYCPITAVAARTWIRETRPSPAKTWRENRMSGNTRTAPGWTGLAGKSPFCATAFCMLATMREFACEQSQQRIRVCHHDER